MKEKNKTTKVDKDKRTAELIIAKELGACPRIANY